MMRNFSFCGAVVLAMALGTSAQAQPYSGDSYASLYSWQLGTSGQTLNPRTYLWDQYYYNNPNISPYLNLMRVQPYGGTDYFNYVQPMEQQRQRQETLSAGGPTRGGHFAAGPSEPSGFNSGMIQPKNPFAKGSSATSSEIMPYSTGAPNRSESYYYNHYYGGWEGRN
ncbi:MAG: hypothetical protein IT427_10175 [Pirellulales bacterium]|nr:hypothetical protein [Pirellulales bacterium]